jgi:DDE family transposase
MTTKEQYAILHPALNELQWRMYLGTEAARIGYGGISIVARASGADRKTIRKGMREITPAFSKARVRQAGGGRKKSTQKDATLVADLESLLEPKGDPMSLVRWTTQSLATLVRALTEKKHTIKKSALAGILAVLGFSLKANKKNIEGVSHPDRDRQFQFIKKSCELFERKGSPIISVDCKKKELIGNFKNQGRAWQPKGKNTIVNVYDFKSLSEGRACPYGVYDIIRNTGFVNVGVDHDTAAFAVESIRRWWRTIGQALYPGKTELLITSDGGGSNGVKSRLWKKELQAFADETGLAVTVAHLPPATSKWNKIEHRLFSYISINWKGKPLVSLETIIELLSHTTTTQGLTVVAVVDQNSYPLGVKVTDTEMEKLHLIRNEFHGDWNYTINPRTG